METAYIEYNGKICVPYDAVKEWYSLSLWQKWFRKAKPMFTTRPGGNGRPSLIELKALPTNYQNEIKQRLGDPQQEANPLEPYFSIDANARTFYDTYRHAKDNKGLEPYQIERYTTNASVLNALARLKAERETMTKRLGNPRRDLKPDLAADCIAFNAVLKLKYNGIQHNLPKNPRKLNEKITRYLREGYALLIDGRQHHTNAQKVSPEMIQLWNDIFAGQRHKPTYLEVYTNYEAFLAGRLNIINSQTGEVYNREQKCFRPISEISVYNYLREWENRIITHAKRNGDRQKFMGKYIPHGSMDAPAYAGSIVSVDDRQPPL